MIPRLRAPAAAFFALALVGLAAAGDIPRAPRIASSPGGRVLAGCQTAPGPDGEFELFVGRDGGGMSGLGRYHGQLAGLAVSRFDERLHGLTRDGVLSVYGDDAEQLTFGDGRWNMQDLAWFDDGPVALDYSGGVLSLARPDFAAVSWRNDKEFIVADPSVAKAVLAPLGDELHLLWSAYSADLSRGALRHAVRRDGRWLELPPLPLGEARTFTVFPREGGLALVAVVPDPLDERVETRLAARTWNGREWLNGPRPPGEIADRLAAAFGIAGTRTDAGDHWLLTGRDGAFVVESRAPGNFGETRLTRGPEGGFGWTELFSLMVIPGFIAVAVLFCRRSRALSRLWPGRPVDLATRGMAIIIDWSLVSVAMTAYHIAAGDVRIHQELLTVGGVNRMFWMNMAALVLFTTATEYLYGRTPGKWLTGLRVRSAYGGPPGFLQTLLRNVMRGVDMFPLVFPGVVGAVAAFLNPRRQRLGDLLGATVVRRHSPLPRRRFLLASASPRRLELLSALGFEVTAEPSDIDEDSIRGENPEATARMLAEAKARAAAQKVSGNAEIVVAADTMVVLDDEVLGKPRDAADARRMLNALSGRSHTVVTGVTVWDSATGQGMSDVETTEVEFRALSEREINDYVATGDPLDKAGAYGVQTAFLVKEVRGSLSNVAGLPMEMLRNMLGMMDS